MCWGFVISGGVGVISKAIVETLGWYPESLVNFESLDPADLDMSQSTKPPFSIFEVRWERMVLTEGIWDRLLSEVMAITEL